MFLLDPANPEHITELLRARNWIPADASTVRVEPAAEGPMNLTLRVHWVERSATRRSAILKHAHPRVERSARTPAPASRILVEADFYRVVAEYRDVAAAMPALLAVDESDRLLWIQDLGDVGKHRDRYGDDALTQPELDVLLRWLSALHRVEVDPERWPALRNRAMRELNHAQLFEIPMDRDQAPELDSICPGLEAASATLRRDPELRSALRQLGSCYLRDGPVLLHGDFHPESWLASGEGPRVIDPAFAFLGRAEFDLGVLGAHLLFTGTDNPDFEAYDPPPRYEPELARAFAGVEVIRRLLGVAQLPLAAELDTRVDWLDAGRRAVLGIRS